MWWFTFGLFAFSAAAIVGLFALKEYESRRGVVFASGARARADAWAERVRMRLLALEAGAEHLPAELAELLRLVVHEIALGAAGTLRFLERKAHDLADLVSHKHRFERKETNSDFLKRVGERRMRSRDPHSGSSV